MVEAAEFHAEFSFAASLRAAQRRGNPENGFTRSHKGHEERKGVEAFFVAFVPLRVFV
jgi:hypothetical protein